jgi:hypothetical protein
MKGYIMSQDKTSSAVEYILTAEQSKQVESSIVAPVAKAHYSSFEAAESLAMFFGTEPSYATWQATQDYTIKSLVANHKIEPKTASNKWYELTKILELTYELVKPKKPTKAAAVMQEYRAKLAAIPESDLRKSIETCAKQGDFKQAQKYKSELVRREKAQASEARKNESKDTTALKKELRSWVTAMNGEQLAAMVWIRNNWSQVTKLTK